MEIGNSESNHNICQFLFWNLPVVQNTIKIEAKRKKTKTKLKAMLICVQNKEQKQKYCFIYLQIKTIERKKKRKRETFNSLVNFPNIQRAGTPPGQFKEPRTPFVSSR